MQPKKAFSYEEGQFICHVQVRIESEEQEQVLNDVIKSIQRAQKENVSKAVENWTPVGSGSHEGSDTNHLHITLIRGHRAVYYHQIKPLIGALQSACENLEPICLCLDEIRILENHEKSKQFLCLAARNNDFSREQSAFNQLKQKLQAIVDRFAIKLTSEHETADTLAHVSLMLRDTHQDSRLCDLKEISDELVRLLSKNLGEQPICLLTIENILVNIGKSQYQLKLVK